MAIKLVQVTRGVSFQQNMNHTFTSLSIVQDGFAMGLSQLDVFTACSVCSVAFFFSSHFYFYIKTRFKMVTRKNYLFTSLCINACL